MLKLLLISVTIMEIISTAQAQYRRVCYYTNWPQYRPGIGHFVPENIDSYLCTHYIYAFSIVRGNEVVPFEWNDDDTSWSHGMYTRFHDAVSRNPNAKTLLAVGGWNLGSGAFHALVATAANRKHFAEMSVNFLRNRNFDGLDIDWEYPANRGGTPDDKQNFVALLQAVRDAFTAEAQRTNRDSLLLTAAVGAGKDKIDTAYDIPRLSQLLDFMSVMTYDLHGSWENHTGPHTPLYSRSGESAVDKTLNLDWAVRYWVQNGAPKNKINVGLATYGRTFTLSNPANNGVGAPVKGPGNPGKYTREKGFLSYQEICQLGQQGAQRHFIAEQRVPYEVRGDQWVGFDNKESLKEKVCYIKTNGYGGVMIWALDLDDFSDSACGMGKYPLINAINQELANPSTAHCKGPGKPSPTSQSPQTTSGTPGHTTQASLSTQPPHIRPDNSFTCFNKVSGFYPSRTDCNEYFICANSMAFRVLCARGLYYNPQTKYCDFPANVHCVTGQTPQPPLILSTTKPTHQPPTQAVTTPAGSTSANFCVQKSNGLFRLPSDCSKYVQCYFRLTFIMDCPSGKVFNERLEACDFRWDVPECV